VIKPASRGRVWLATTNPADPPRIEFAHLRETSDVTRMVEAMRQVRHVATTPPLLAVHGANGSSPRPDVWVDDARLGRWLRRNAWTYHHPVGTCRMGLDPDTGAVVDNWGRVHGLSGLVIADASIMPDIPSANTNLPTVMIAHRVAESLAMLATKSSVV